MKKRKSLFTSVFAKYMSLFSLLLVAGILVVGVAQLLLSTSFWVREQRKTLSEDARLLALNITEQVERDAFSEYLPPALQDNNVVQELVETVSVTSDIEVMLTDSDGDLLLLASRQSADPAMGSKLSENLVAELKAAEGTYFTSGTLDGLFSKRRYAAAEPIYHRDRMLGYVFVISSAGSLGMYLGAQAQMYLLAALIALLLGTIGCYVITYRMVKPLRQMAAVTHRFGEGDFSARVQVEGADEIAQLAQSLNEMAVSLSAVEGMSRSFVANVSHELKTPMTTIEGFVDGVLDGTIPPERQAHYLQIVSDEIKRLSRLVNAMLNLSRIDNGTLALRPVRFDLSELVCKTALSFEQRAEQKQLSVEGLEHCTEPCFITADFDLIGQVVYNLLDNAIKFVNSGGTVRLHVQRQNDRVFCTVRNSGEGVSAEEMPHLFERFYKSDKSRGMDKSGVGLGLYIVHQVIQLHGGEITVCSRPDDYTEFSFWLPSVAE